MRFLLLLMYLGRSELGSPECCMHMLRCHLSVAQCACYYMQRCSLHILPIGLCQHERAPADQQQWQRDASSGTQLCLGSAQAVSSLQSMLVAGACLSVIADIQRDDCPSTCKA